MLRTSSFTSLSFISFVLILFSSSRLLAYAFTFTPTSSSFSSSIGNSRYQHNGVNRNRELCVMKAGSGSTPVDGIKNILIVQNKGGGHGELGYHLAKQLNNQGYQVTMLNDVYNDKKAPFSSYDQISSDGVEILTTSFSAENAADEIKTMLDGKTFDVVYDNAAKSVDDASRITSLATNAKWPVKHYVFVSSGGMYTSEFDEYPLLETSSVKENAARQIELHIEGLGLPYTFFRPQYIYGPLTNKRDYLDYFVHRIIRDLPVPVPNHGDQFTTVTDARDIASMLASVIGNEESKKQIFNAASDRYYSYKEICRQVASACGKSDTFDLTKALKPYDPKKFELPKGFFPFRNEHFPVCAEKAKRVLGWKPKYTLQEELPSYVKGYKAENLDSKEMDFETDKMVMAKAN